MTQRPLQAVTETVWLRALVVFLLTFLALTLAMACSSRQPTPPDSVTIITTASSAEPPPTLPKSVQAQVMSLAEQSETPGQAMVRVVSSTEGPVYEQDMTAVRGNGQIENAASAKQKKIRAAVDQLNHHLADMTASVPGLDLLKLLDRASTLPGSRTYVLSSGLSTEAPMDFRALGFDFRPDAVVDSVERQGHLPNLTGRHVTFFGLGMTTGTQPTLPPAARESVEKLYLRLCERAHADGCVVVHDGISTDQPKATLPVPVVPVPAVITEGGCPVAATFADSTLHFAGDSAVLGLEADTVLRPLVEQLRSCDLVVDLFGNVADTGNGDPSNLSGRRARAVADRLLALGLPPQQLGTVVGRGATQPVVPNLVNGVFVENLAQLNRRTELAFHHLHS